MLSPAPVALVAVLLTGTLCYLHIDVDPTSVVDALYMILFHDNLDSFSQKTTKGELDLLLAKPVNSQFMMSCQKVSVPYFVNLLFIFA